MVTAHALRRPWESDVDREQACFTSALAIAQFALTDPDLLPAHQTELLSLAIWKWAERDGKWHTRYRSAGAVELGAGWRAHVNHEHVYPRLTLRMAMFADPGHVADILHSAAACVVTRTEHTRLSAIGSEYPGWQRYLAAEVDVYDMADGTLVIEAGGYVGNGPSE